MVTPIDEDTNLLLWGDLLVRITKSRENGHVEIVAHPSSTMSASFRQAREPYECRLHLADGRDVKVDLATADDWGNIQDCYPDECKRWPALGWGSDADGHVEIVRVTDIVGDTIPLGEFEQDVKDMIIHHED